MATDWRVPLWNAINNYVRTCRGDPDSHVYGNTPRQKAVHAIERVINIEREELRQQNVDLRLKWKMIRDHVTIIADGGARNEERQKVFVELRDMMARLDEAK